MKEKGIIFYQWWEVFFDELSDVEAGQLIKAVFRYADTGRKPEGLSPAVNMALVGIIGSGLKVVDIEL